MTREDFIESVIAGWIPLGFPVLGHIAAAAWRWMIVRVGSVITRVFLRA